MRHGTPDYHTRVPRPDAFSQETHPPASAFLLFRQTESAASYTTLSKLHLHYYAIMYVLLHCSPWR
jgi:hypothetical protein